MTDEERKRLEELNQKYISRPTVTVNANLPSADTELGAANQRYVKTSTLSPTDYSRFSETGGYGYRDVPTIAPMRRIYRNERSEAYLGMNEDERKLYALYNQAQTLQKAKEAAKANGFAKKGVKWEDYTKSRELVKHLEDEYKKMYEDYYGTKVSGWNWLGQTALTGTDVIASGLVNTAKMASDWVEKNRTESIETANFNRWILNKMERGDINPDSDDPLERLFANYMSAREARKNTSIFESKGGRYKNIERQLYRQLEEAYARANPAKESAIHEAVSNFADRHNDIYNQSQEAYEIQKQYQQSLKNSEFGKGLVEFAGAGIMGAEQALVAFGLGAMTGGTGTGYNIGQTLSQPALTTAAKVGQFLQGYAGDPQFYLSFSQEAGSTYRDALAQGVDQDKAITAAAITGLINAAIEVGIPENEATGGFQGLLQQTKDAGKSKGQAVIDWLISSGQEGGEEILQNAVSNLTEKIAYNRNKAWSGENGVFDWKSSLEEGGVGLAVGMLMGGGHIAINRAAQARADKPFAETGAALSESADALIENALKMSPATQSYQIADEIDKRGSHTDTDIGKLYNAYIRDSGYYDTNRAELARAAEERINALNADKNVTIKETGDIKEIARVVAKAASGYNLTSDEQKTLKNSVLGQRVYNEYINAFDKTFSAEWSEKLKAEETKRRAEIEPQLSQEQKEIVKQSVDNYTETTYGPSKETLEKMASRYGSEANVFQEAVKTIKPENVRDFETAYFNVFLQGQSGIDFDNAYASASQTSSVNQNKYYLTKEQAKLAWESGVRSAPKDMPRTKFKLYKTERAGVSVKIEGMTAKEFRAKFNDKQNAAYKALTKISKLTGVSIVLFKGTTDKNGKYIGYRGKYENGTIYIDVDAGLSSTSDSKDLAKYALLRTASHEFTHYLQRNAKAEYTQLKNAVFANLMKFEWNGNTYTADEWIERKLAQAEKAGIALDPKDAADECVADACEMMLRNTAAFESLAKENQNLAQRFVEWLRDFINDIKEAFAGVTEKSLEAEAMIDDLENIQRLWDNAMIAAVHNTQLKNAVEVNAESTEAIPVETKTQYSFTSLAEAAGFEAVEDKFTGERYFMRDGKAADKVTMEDIENSPIGALVNFSQQKNDITAEEAKAQKQMFVDVCNMAIQQHDFQQAMKFVGAAMFTGIKANSDAQYGTTYDFGTICTKTQAVIDAMSAEMMHRKGGLTNEQILKIYRDVFASGNPVPCPECYVFTHWVGIGGLLDKIYKYQTKYGQMTPAQVKEEYRAMEKQIKDYVEEYNKTAPKDKQLTFGRAKGKIEKLVTDKYNTVDERIREAEDAGKKVSKKDLADRAALETQMITAGAMTWIRDVYFTDGAMTKVRENYAVPSEILFDLNKGDQFASEYSAAWGFRTTQGAGYGKAITPYADASLGEGIIATNSGINKLIKAKADGSLKNIFLDQHGKLNKDALKILNGAREKAKKQSFLGGQRFQSTSDARYENASDYLLAALEMQAMNGMVQVYTKVDGAVPAFATWGFSINQSLMPLGGGLKEDGTLKDTKTGGMAVDVAAQNRSEYESAGTITIGVNDNHIRAVINQIIRDFVIPYHASGGKKDLIAEFRAVQDKDVNKKEFVQSTDYTRTQSDKILSDDVLRWQGRSEEEIKRVHAVREARIAILTGKNPDMKVVRSNKFLSALYDKFHGGEWDGVTIGKSKIEHTIFPNEFWDKSVTYENSKKITEDYLEYCNDLGFLHRFSGMVPKGERGLVPINGYNERGEKVPLQDLAYKYDENGNKTDEVEPFFWKTLTDRRMYDNDGNYLEQKNIRLSTTTADTVANFAKNNTGRQYNKAMSQVISKARLNDIDYTPEVKNPLAELTKKTQYQRELEDVDFSELSSRYDQLAKNPTKNSVELYKIVREVARRSGYTSVSLYHGTDKFGFTRIKTYGLESGEGHEWWSPFFTASTLETSASYLPSQRQSVRRIGKTPIALGEFNKRVGETVKQAEHYWELAFGEPAPFGADSDMSTVYGKIGVQISKVNKGFADVYDPDAVSRLEAAYKILGDLIDEDFTGAPQAEAAWTSLKDATRDFLNALKDSYERAGLDPDDYIRSGEQYIDYLADEMTHDSRSYSEIEFIWDWLKDTEIDDMLDDVMNEVNMPRAESDKLFEAAAIIHNALLTTKEPEEGIYEFYADTSNLLEIDAHGGDWFRIALEDLEEDFNDWLPNAASTTQAAQLIGTYKTHVKTRVLAEYAEANGYSGVRIRNLVDSGAGYVSPADIYIFFEPEYQVKSADPVTYDDDGNVIPLEERFDSSNIDVRYQREMEEIGFAQYQMADTEASSRELLAGALATIVENEAERAKLEEYQKVLGELNEAQQRADELGRQIYNIAFTKGADRSGLDGLKSEKAALEKKLDGYDKRLLSLQNTKPLKDVLERERKRVRRQTRTETLTEARRRKETTAIRNKIKDLVTSLQKPLQNPTRTRNIPQDLVGAVAEMVNMIDSTTARTKMSTRQHLDAIKAEYEKLMVDPLFKADPKATKVIEMIEDLKRSALDDNGDPVNLYDMDYDQLTGVYNALKAMVQQISDVKKMKSRAYTMEAYDLSRKLIMETLEADPLVKNKRLADLIQWQLDPESFFARMGGHVKDSAWVKQVAKSFMDGTIRALRVQYDFYDHFSTYSEASELNGLTNWRKTVDLGCLFDEEGNSIKLPRGMWLSLYMHLGAEDNRLAILYGGLNIPDLKAYHTGHQDAAYGQGSAIASESGHANIMQNMVNMSRELDDLRKNRNTMPKEEYVQRKAQYEEMLQGMEAAGLNELDRIRQTIYNEMTPMERQFVEAVETWYKGKAKDYANEVTLDMFGYKGADVDYYFPIHRNKDFIKSVTSAGQQDNPSLLNANFMKARVRSSAPVYLTNIVYELDQSVSALSRYYGYAIAQADFDKVYKLAPNGGKATPASEIGKKFGEGKRTVGVSAERYIQNLIGDITGGRTKPDANLGSIIRRNLPRGSLTLNLRVALSQTASIPTAAAEVGWGPMLRGFAKGLPTALTRKGRQELMKKSPLWFQRYRGEGGMREFADMKGGNTFVDDMWRKAEGKPLGHWLLNWCQNMDVFATATMWSMAEEWVKENTNLTGEEFEAAVEEKFNDIIRRTQPNYTTTERSDLLRDNREAYKFLTMYKTQSNKNFNILFNANATLRKYQSDFKNGRNGVTAEDVKWARKRFANAYTALFIGATPMFVLLRVFADFVMGALRDYRDDKDEITGVAVANAALKQYSNTVAGMFVFGSQISDAVYAYITKTKWNGIEDSAWRTLREAGEQSLDIAQKIRGGEAGWNDYLKTAQKWFTLAGLPWNPVKNLVGGLVNHVKDISNGEFLSYEAGVTRNNTTNYMRLYDALEKGDTAKADRVRAELARNEVDEDTIRAGLLKIVKGMWQDGTYSVDEAVEKYAEYSGKDKDTAYWEVQKWINKAEDEDASTSPYYRVYNLIDNGLDATDAINELTTHGKSEDDVASAIRKHIKDAFNDGDITEKEALDAIRKYGKHKVNKQLAEYSAEEAEALVESWAVSKSLGWDYDDKETLYANGEITANELKRALTGIGGMSEEKANRRIEQYDWANEGFEVTDNQYDSIIGTYKSTIRQAGISKAIWYNYYVFQSKTTADKDANGNSINGTKMAKVFEYIGSLNITSDQKMALARTYTQNEKNIAKYRTW